MDSLEGHSTFREAVAPYARHILDPSLDIAIWKRIWLDEHASTYLFPLM